MINTTQSPIGPTFADDWLEAWRFAAEVHNAQKVPGTELPYLRHLGMVTMEIFTAHATSPISNLSLSVRCAILHDTIEDQGVTHEELVKRFGHEVANGVLALSKNAELPKSAAMDDSLARIRAQPPAVWCVKLADRISNLHDVPAHWSAEKCETYRAEAQKILNELGSAHETLATRLAAKIKAYKKN